ncbi:hypothetical protein ACFSCV_07910 [Methylopila henanensis]|uniref:Uncharacterized protein n=1 Tax=Methylopila henanensis TaxID=873516 RepID=A0ABW4K8R7_9HYPH
MSFKRLIAPLPSASYLSRLDDACRRSALNSHATILYREAAHAIAPRVNEGLNVASTQTKRELTRARRSARDRLRRLYDRADHFGVDVGQPRILSSNASVSLRFAKNGLSTKAKFDFAEAFQTTIVAFILRDSAFAQRVGGLIKPEYFVNEADAALARIAMDYYAVYKKAPDKSVVGRLLKKAIDAEKLHADLIEDIKLAFGNVLRADLSDRDFVIDKVTDFNRRSVVWPRLG